MNDDPQQLLARWLPGVPGDNGFFPLVALATVDLAGEPDVRTVLLSRLTADGLHFNTDSRSRKVLHLQRLPAVAMMISLPEQARQVVVRGPVRQQSQFELASAFRSRSHYLKLLAWLNTPDMAELAEGERHHRWAQFAGRNPGDSLKAPREWAGFVVAPRRITFWEGDIAGPSHRVEYTRQSMDWTATHLPG